MELFLFLTFHVEAGDENEELDKGDKVEFQHMVVTSSLNEVAWVFSGNLIRQVWVAWHHKMASTNLIYFFIFAVFFE